MPDLIPDTTRVRAFLRQRCPIDLVDRLELTYLKLKSDGTGGRFLYEARDARHAPLRISACRISPESGRTSETPPSARGPQPLYSPDLRLLFQIFPADRKLESLRTLTDGNAMAPILQKTLDGVAGAVVRKVAVSVVRYKPERKCVLRYDVAWTGDDRPSVVYAKVLRPPRLGRTTRLLTAIRESGNASGFALPEPLGLLPRLRAEFFSFVPGTPLSALGEAAGFPEACRRVGRALRKFHALRVPAPPANMASRVEQLERNAAALGLLLPSDARHVESLGRRIALRLRATPSHPPCLVHGDFHGDNLLVDRDRVGLVDLDDCALGDPADDLGSMWAQLRWLSLKGSRKPQLLERGRRAFLDGYLEGCPDVASRVPVAAALHCFLFAYQCLRRPAAPSRREQARGLLATSETILEKGLA